MTRSHDNARSGVNECQLGPTVSNDGNRLLENKRRALDAPFLAPVLEEASLVPGKRREKREHGDFRMKKSYSTYKFRYKFGGSLRQGSSLRSYERFPRLYLRRVKRTTIQEKKSRILFSCLQTILASTRRHRASPGAHFIYNTRGIARYRYLENRDSEDIIFDLR